MTPRTIRNPVTNTLYTIRPRSSKAGQKPIRGLWANPPPYQTHDNTPTVTEESSETQSK